MKHKYSAVAFIILLLASLVTVFPLIVVLIGSFTPMSEILRYYGSAAFSAYSSGDYVSICLFPSQFVLEQYADILNSQVNTLIMYCNSIFYTGAIVILQLVITCPAAYAFAKMKFPFKPVIYLICILVTMMPQQIMLVPNYFVISRIGMINSPLSVVLPAAFSTVGMFILTQYMKNVPDSISEAAKVDGAGEFRLFINIVLPLSRNAVVVLILLTVADQWNMLEAPLLFLRFQELRPLSTAYYAFTQAQLPTLFAVVAVFTIPVLLLYALCEDSLIETIDYAQLV